MQSSEPWTETFRVGSADCGPDGFLRLPRLLDFLQEVASENARELGFDFPEIGEVGPDGAPVRGAWVLSQLRLRIDRPMRWRESLRIATVPWGVRAATASRDFEVFGGDGARCAAATTRWALISPLTRRAVRVPAFIAERGGVPFAPFGPGPAFAAHLRWPEGAPDDVPGATSHRAERAHIDLNGHVNNTVQVGWMLESVPEEAIAGRRLSEFEIAFRAETLLGAAVRSESLPVEPGRFLHRVRVPGELDHALGASSWVPLQ